MTRAKVFSKLAVLGPHVLSWRKPGTIVDPVRSRTLQTSVRKRRAQRSRPLDGLESWRRASALTSTGGTGRWNYDSMRPRFDRAEIGVAALFSLRKMTDD